MRNYIMVIRGISQCHKKNSFDQSLLQILKPYFKHICISIWMCANKWLKLNCYSDIATLEIIELCANKWLKELDVLERNSWKYLTMQ